MIQELSFRGMAKPATADLATSAETRHPILAGKALPVLMDPGSPRLLGACGM